jgi:HK97 gp10 family phage protein
MASGVHFKGLRETVRSLEKLGVQVSDLKAAFKKIGNLVATDAKSRAPKKSGALAATIKPSNTKNKSVIRAGSARVPYAGVIHYGGYNNIEPHPYLTNAVDAKQKEAVNVMEEELDKLIRSLGLD